MKALAVLAALFAFEALADDPAYGVTDRRWTGSVALMWGEAGPHASTTTCCLPSSLDGYAEFGRKLGNSVALLAVGIGEYGLVQDQVTHLLSGGLAVRLIGDRLGGLEAPLELTVGAGVGHVMQGNTSLDPLTYGMAFVDTIFPLTAHFRLHSQIIEHVDYLTGSAFLTAGVGLGVTFE